MKKLIIIATLLLTVTINVKAKEYINEKPIVVSLGKARNMRMAVFNSAKAFNRFTKMNPMLEIKDIQMSDSLFMVVYLVPYEQYKEEV